MLLRFSLLVFSASFAIHKSQAPSRALCASLRLAWSKLLLNTKPSTSWSVSDGGGGRSIFCRGGAAAPRRWRRLGQPLFCARGSFQTRGLVGSVRGERPEPMLLAACARVPCGQRRQSLIALASRWPNVRECVACPGSGSPRCASRRVRSRPNAVGGGGGGSFEHSPRRTRRATW